MAPGIDPRLLGCIMAQLQLADVNISARLENGFVDYSDKHRALGTNVF